MAWQSKTEPPRVDLTRVVRKALAKCKCPKGEHSDTNQMCPVNIFGKK
jgi:hypothetical protein